MPQITILARIGMPDDNHKHFQIRIRLPIQLLTCKMSEGNTVLPEYAEAPDVLGLDESPTLCRCVSSSRDSCTIQEIDEQDDEGEPSQLRAPDANPSPDPPAYPEE